MNGYRVHVLVPREPILNITNHLDGPHEVMHEKSKRRHQCNARHRRAQHEAPRQRLLLTAITTDATKPIHTHLRNLPTGTVAIFAPRNTQPITLAKHVDDTWRGYAGDRPITLTTSSIYSRNGSFTIIHTPEW